MYIHIKQILLIRAGNFAGKRVNITKEGIVIIKHARKFLLDDNS